MTIAKRLRKARACVDVAKKEVADLHDFFFACRASRVNEARVTNDMKQQLTRISTRLENMAKHNDIFGRA